MNDRFARVPDRLLSVVSRPEVRGERRRGALDLGDMPHARLEPPELLPLHPLAMRQCEEIQTRLWLSNPGGRVYGVTAFVGASTGCGASTVAANFAAALAGAVASEVLLIRFLERPNLRRDPPGALDLERWLEDECAAPRASAHTPRNLYLLTSASLGATASSVLRSTAFEDFLSHARVRFDHIVVDAPPLQGHAESLVLCRKADAVVLVVRAGQTRHHTARWAYEEITQAQANVAGVVLNRYRHYIPRWLYRLI